MCSDGLRSVLLILLVVVGTESVGGRVQLLLPVILQVHKGLRIPKFVRPVRPQSSLHPGQEGVEILVLLLPDFFFGLRDELDGGSDDVLFLPLRFRRTASVFRRVRRRRQTGVGQGMLNVLDNGSNFRDLLPVAANLCQDLFFSGRGTNLLFLVSCFFDSGGKFPGTCG
jgi:hypothetical protein